MKKFYFYYLFLLVLSLVTLSCSTDDEAGLPDQYLKANVNGLEFNSDQTVSSLKLTREIGPDGRINLYVKAISTDGDIIEFLVENFQGSGKYNFGDQLYNNSWIKYERPSTSERWLVEPRGAFNLPSNFIEVTSIEGNLVEGRISCKELKSSLEDYLGVVEGEFRLKYYQ